MHVGFTGTQQGMTEKQKEVVLLLLESVESGGAFHHGDCIGADAQAATIARSIGYPIKGHPPINDSKRAFFDSDDESEPKEYLVRNHDIVDESEIMIAAPKEEKEILRSGTWSTIRYAMKQDMPLYIVYPDGTLEMV